MADQEFTLTQEYLLSIFDYKDGNLYWKKSVGKRGKIGNLAGSLHHSGYKYVKLNGKSTANHRIIFMMHHGYFPEEVDHIDRNRANNNINNLRASTNEKNALNKSVGIHNKAGIRGVYFDKRNKKWSVQISVNKKQKYFGQYFDIKVAQFVAETMRHKYQKV